MSAAVFMEERCCSFREDRRSQAQNVPGEEIHGKCRDVGEPERKPHPEPKDPLPLDSDERSAARGEQG